jgi:hypothetical protein
MCVSFLLHGAVMQVATAVTEGTGETPGLTVHVQPLAVPGGLFVGMESSTP